MKHLDYKLEKVKKWLPTAEEWQIEYLTRFSKYKKVRLHCWEVWKDKFLSTGREEQIRWAVKWAEDQEIRLECWEFYKEGFLPTANEREVRNLVEHAKDKEIKNFLKNYKPNKKANNFLDRQALWGIPVYGLLIVIIGMIIIYLTTTP